MSDWGWHIYTEEEIRSMFYEWEKKKFPEGDSPYSDDDINIWVLGFMEGQATESSFYN
jgi:hypothetical protein|tara:strand:+ start:1035 stop:1208 length:174 start_codon:yes stop_codon:yes gene_type:complete